MDETMLKKLEEAIVGRITNIENMVKVAPEKHAKALEEKLNTEFNAKISDLVKAELDKKFAELQQEIDKQKSRKLHWSADRKTLINAQGEEEFSLAKMFKGMKTGDWSESKFELGIIEKAMSEGTNSAGGFLVPEEYLLEIKDRISALAVVRQFGVTTYPMRSDTLNIPRVSGGATGYWIGENTTITASDLTMAQLALVAKKLAALVKVSTELMSDSNPKVEAVIRRDLAKVIALTEDLAFLNATASATVPGGILTVSGTAEVTNGANGGTPTFDTFYDALYQVELANGLADGWVMHPRTKNTLRKIKDTNNNYIYNVNPSIKEPPTVFGLPVKMTTQLPINLTVGTSNDCTSAIVAQWDEAVIGDRGFMEFALDTSGVAFSDYQTWIRAISRVDFGLRTAGVFCKITGIRP